MHQMLMSKCNPDAGAEISKDQVTEDIKQKTIKFCNKIKILTF